MNGLKGLGASMQVHARKWSRRHEKCREAPGGARASTRNAAEIDAARELQTALTFQDASPCSRRAAGLRAVRALRGALASRAGGGGMFSDASTPPAPS